MKKGKRFLSLLMAFIMSLGVFSGLTTNVFAATQEMEIYLLALPRASDSSKATPHKCQKPHYTVDAK